MNNNELLRSLRKVLAANENTMTEIYQLSGAPLDMQTMKNMLRHDNESSFESCSNETLSRFLDALIVSKRGPLKNAQEAAHYPMSNNQVLKKLRVAFELKDDDMNSLFLEAGTELSKQELKSLFRNENHKNFKLCDDTLLRNFLSALAQKQRATN